MLLINALNMLTIDLSLHIALLGVSLIRKLALINLLNYLEKVLQHKPFSPRVSFVPLSSHSCSYCRVTFDGL